MLSTSNSPELPSGWKILHLDLSRCDRVSLEPGYDGLYLCFWHNETPLGHCELHYRELPLTESQVRNIAANVTAPAIRAYLEAKSGDTSDYYVNSERTLLARLSASWRDTRAAPDDPKVSLVICTRDRPRHLERCLRSITTLRLQPSQIIVVDNGISHEETQRVASQFDVLYTIEPRLGLSRARNAGVRLSSSPLIAFTDDDIVVTPDWLFYLVDAIRDAHVSAASGLVLPAELRTSAQVIFEYGFGGFHQGYIPRLYGPDFIHNSGFKSPPVWSICAGGNMIVRRDTFESVGFFDERLGAGAAGCSEDSEFWYRILANGGSCAYVPAAAVYHYHREDMDNLKRQIFMYMRGHVTALLIQCTRFRHWKNLLRIFVELPVYYGESVFRSVLCQSKSELVILEGAKGSLAGIGYWLRYCRS
jgi:GT2 family glycosyltransferase